MNTFKISLFFLLCTCVSLAQSLNTYKYVEIPEQFGFQKEANSYQINELTKFLLNKYEFQATLTSESRDPGIQPCEVLRATMDRKNTMMRTAVTLKLTNCQGNIVYTSPEGNSREKDFQKAYHEAVRKALDDPILKNHTYTAPLAVTAAKNLPPSAMLLNKPAPKKPIQSMPVAKQKPTPLPVVVEQPKAMTADLYFEWRGKKYGFTTKATGYAISANGQLLGAATLLPNGGKYKIDAGSLSGTGYFDDYGNFVLERMNPVTQKPITDVMGRVDQ